MSEGLLLVAGVALGMVPALFYIAAIRVHPAWRRDERRHDR